MRDHTFSFAFRTLGMAVSGTVAVEPTRVRLAAALPLAAAFFKGTIEEHSTANLPRPAGVSSPLRISLK